jgi:hypothetical protein
MSQEYMVVLGFGRRGVVLGDNVLLSHFSNQT